MRLERIRRRLQERRNDNGFSLVEVAITLLVFSIVTALIFGTVINVLNAGNSVRDRNQEEADTRLAIDTLVRDLRQAYTGSPTMFSVKLPPVAVPVSTATTIIFYSPDRAPDFRLRLITYSLIGTTITRTVQTSNEVNSTVGTTGNWTFPAATPGPVVLTGVISLLFTYLDQASPPVVATTGAALQAVLIDLVVNQTPRSSPIPQTYHTQVDLRVTN